MSCLNPKKKGGKKLSPFWKKKIAKFLSQNLGGQKIVDWQFLVCMLCKE